MNLITLPIFAEADVFNVVVESPRGATLKLKYEPRYEAVSVSRPLPLGLTFPYDWGFIPSTSGPDGDPVDALLLWDVASYPGVVVPCRAIGLLQVEQNRGDHNASQRIRNDRILALPAAARREQVVSAVSSLSPRIRAELEHFSVAAGALDGKAATVVGWGEAADAMRLIRASASPQAGRE